MAGCEGSRPVKSCFFGSSSQVRDHLSSGSSTEAQLANFDGTLIERNAAPSK
jgi:hypothetical protein